MLFARDVKTIRKHIKNALREELEESLVVAKFASTKKFLGIWEKVHNPNFNSVELDRITEFQSGRI